MRRKIVQGIEMVILLVLSVLIGAEMVYAASYNNSKNAFVYQEELFSAGYSGNFILIQSCDKVSGLTGITLDWGISTVYGYKGTNTSRRNDVYVDHYRGAFINGDWYDVREYTWKEGTGIYCITDTEWIDGNPRKTGGMFTTDVSNIKIHREFHFYKKGTLEDGTMQEVSFQGLVNLCDLDKDEGYYIPEKNLNRDSLGRARVFVGPENTSVGMKSSVKYNGGSSNTWIGTIDNDDRFFSNCAIWAEVHGSPASPLELVYVTATQKASDVNYYNDRIPVNYYIVDNAGCEGITAPFGTSVPRYSYFNPIKNEYKGYSFSGWYEDAELTKPVGNTIEIRNQNYINLYGKYTVTYSYAIRYDPNGGLGGAGSMVHKTQNIPIYQNFTIADNEFYNTNGYKFVNWAVVRTSDHTVFCIDGTWKPLGSTVAEYWARYNEGDVCFMSEWWLNSNSEAHDTFIFYAQWVDSPSTVPTHTLTINPNGGTWNGSTVAKSFTMREGENRTISDPVREGYLFTGWTPIGKLTNKVFTMGTSDVTLTAEWSIDNYTVTLNKGIGISAVSGGGQKSYGSSVIIDASVEDGYHWKNWTGTLGTTTTKRYTFTMPANAVTMTANADPNTYKIKFNGNGSTSGSMSDMSCVYDKVYTLTSNMYGRTGYIFKGWNTKADGTGTAYANHANVKNLTITNGATVTLYAQWKLNYYSVNLITGYGIESVSVTGNNVNNEGKFGYGSSVTITAKEKSGFHFVNWTGTYITNQQTYTFTMPPNDVTMTANGEANFYTLKFHPNDGGTVTPLTDVVVKYDGTVILSNGSLNFVKYTLDGVNVTDSVLSEVVLEAYSSVFRGWSLEAEKSLYVPTWQANVEVNVKTIVDSAGVTIQNGADIMLYAIWDDCPWIAAEDLYFTLKEAQTGFITYDELMNHAAASDREDGSVILPGEDTIKGTSFKVIDYQAEEYIGLTADGSITETYQVIDSSGNVYEKMIAVYVVDSAPQLEMPNGTTRFINEKYYHESYEKGGLEENSVWKTDPEYVEIMKETFENSRNDTPVIERYFTYEEILEMK